MITTIQIEGLRCIRFGMLDGMPGLSVLVGRNGSGKSTVLDALHIGAHPHPHTALHDVGARREGEAGRSLLALGRWGEVDSARVWLRGPHDREVRILGRDAVGPWPGVGEVTRPSPVKELVRWAAPTDGPDGGLLAGLHARAARLGCGAAIAGMVREALPDCTGLDVLFVDGRPRLHALRPPGPVPIADCGDGLHALVGFAMRLAATEPPALVLADGPDASVHRDLLRPLADAVRAAVARGVQAVLTTQRLDTLDALCVAFADDPDGFAVFRLAPGADGVLAVSRFAGADATFACDPDVSDDLR